MNTKINTGPSVSRPSVSIKSGSPDDRITAMKQSPHNIELLSNNGFDQDQTVPASPAPEQRVAQQEASRVSSSSKVPPPAVHIGEQARRPSELKIDYDHRVEVMSKPTADQLHVE